MARSLKIEAKSEKPLILVDGSASLIGSKCVETFADDYTLVGMDVKPAEDDAREQILSNVT